MTWDLFKKERDKQYSQKSTRDQKAAEFYNLVQGSTTVARYTSHKVADETKEAKKFQRILALYI